MADGDSGTSSLRADLAAAVAIGAGALLAAGYGITLARLYNIDVPSGPVLAALPHSYLIGEALHPLLLICAVALVGGVLCLWSLRLKRFHPNAKLPGRLPKIAYWVGAGLVVAACYWGIDAFLRHGGTEGAKSGYPLGLAVVVLIVAVCSMGLGWLVRERFDGLKPATEGARLKLGLGLFVLITILAASSVRICNAMFLEDSLPVAFVSAQREDCPFLPGTSRCFFHGYYFGESDQWLFLIQVPTRHQPYLRRHLLMIPRDDIQQTVIAQDIHSIPPQEEPIRGGPAYGVSP